eukprot:CAMPEP_0177668776 /NCGR_PEP_ID=MMETSP0447-20121125/22998_1 /TAXON_ID=0 /ORGANISM="Stygamoeba regulata, Strain BSH-02190019" /LENGTH=49 /DNA_ID= /DNA_START= /DNA_END= /DNA_ORIENTATION=
MPQAEQTKRQARNQSVTGQQYWWSSLLQVTGSSPPHKPEKICLTTHLTL